MSCTSNSTGIKEGAVEEMEEEFMVPVQELKKK